MTKPKSPEDLRFCCVSGGDCHAPAGYGISGVGTCSGDKGTQGTCFSCGEPVCAGENCSKRMQWHKYGRKRICKNCHDPEDKKEQAERERETKITMELPQEGLDRLWQLVQAKDPKVAAMFKRFKVKKFGVWDIDPAGFLVR